MYAPCYSPILSLPSWQHLQRYLSNAAHHSFPSLSRLVAAHRVRAALVLMT